jgi:hypothetical protein
MFNGGKILAAQPHGWINNNLGWIILFAALVTAGVTIVYVVLTWKLVRVDGEATREAQEANKLARQAITASQYANNLAQEALKDDRRQLELAVKNKQDAAMPPVVIEFRGSRIHRLDVRSMQTSRFGSMSRKDFDATDIALDSDFQVDNHGTEPALVWIDVQSDLPVHISLNNQEIDSGTPVITEPAGRRMFGLRFISSGHFAYETIGGKEYALVRFRWAAYAQRDTYDTASFSLRAGSSKVVSGNVNDESLATTFGQPPALLLPEERHYPE